MNDIVFMIAKGFNKIGQLLEGCARSTDGHRERVRKASSLHDMARHPDEGYYAAQYLHWIRKTALPRLAGRDVVALDLGCGQGRLAIVLAEVCKNMVGVDLTPEVIARAKEYALEAGRKNIDFVVADALSYAQKQASGTFDLILLTEVTFFLPEYREVLKEMHRILKLGGVIAVSFRSQYFDILHSARHQKWDSARMAVEQREGYLWGGGTWFSWHTSEDIRHLMAGFSQVDLMGIGVCSGIEGDPLSLVAQPSLLDVAGREKMLALELDLAQRYADNGRYILVVGTKQE
jgi:SAM-dependent methyltransferase